MPAIPEDVRQELKKPLGELMQFRDFLARYRGKRIIAVGDIVTLSLLESGIRPFLAVYDFRTMRAGLEERGKDKIRAAYPEFLAAKNPPGEITRELEGVASSLSKEGGALFVEGEEDLAALVFMRISPPGCVIIYGQPEEGVVAVECGEKSREKAEKMFERIGKG